MRRCVGSRQMAKYRADFKVRRARHRLVSFNGRLQPCSEGDWRRRYARKPAFCLVSRNTKVPGQVSLGPAEEGQAQSQSAGNHASGSSELFADVMCFADRYIIVDAAVRRFQPADSAISSNPSSHGLRTSRHSFSCARKSLWGCVGAARVPIPVIVFIGYLEASDKARALEGAGCTCLRQKSIPAPAGIAGAASFFGFSAIMASVVTSRPAIEAASCSAVRTTLAGSITPCL